MTDKTLAQAAQSGANVRSAVPTTSQVLRYLADMFARKYPNKDFEAIPDIEYKVDEVVNLFDAKGTVLMPIIDKLNELGISTEPTLGGFRASLPDLTRTEIHDLMCTCKSIFVTGVQMADRLRTLADIKELATQH
jgi:hypothetical protein